MLHVGGPGLREIFYSFSEEERAGQNPYNIAMTILNGFFELKRNVPKARQNFLETVPKPGETINYYIVWLKDLVRHCDYGDDAGNQVRDRVLSHIKDPSLKSRIYREDELTLAKLTTIVSGYHDKDAMILIPEDTNVNRVSSRGSWRGSSHVRGSNTNKGQRGVQPTKPFSGSCGKCGFRGHKAVNCRRSLDHICERCNLRGHYATSCHTQPQQGQSRPQPRSYQSSGRQSNSNYRGRGQGRARSPGRGNIRSVGEKPEEDEGPAYYVFTIRETSYLFNTKQNHYEDMLKFKVNGKMLEMVVDSGAFHNMMTQKDFEKLSQEQLIKLEGCEKKLYAYAAKEPLPLLGQCQVTIEVPETGKSAVVNFVVIANA